jgi:hypothetical protein
MNSARQGTGLRGSFLMFWEHLGQVWTGMGYICVEEVFIETGQAKGVSAGGCMGSTEEVFADGAEEIGGGEGQTEFGTMHEGL